MRRHFFSTLVLALPLGVACSSGATPTGDDGLAASAGGSPAEGGGGLGPMASGGDASETGGSATGGNSGEGATGGTASGSAASGGEAGSVGGAASGGGESGGTGGAVAGGGGAGNAGGAVSGGSTSLSAPTYSTDFSRLDGWQQAPKSSLLPGATASIESDADAVDGQALAFTIPGSDVLGATDYVGPGAHAIEVVRDGEAQLYGRYEFDVRFPACAAKEDLVTGLFTYFNDGSDGDADGIGDNSEIDIEHLCGDPQYLYLTVWTDYEESPALDFRRTSRVINMRTGQYDETPAGSSSWDDLAPGGTLADVAIVNFPEPGVYYTLGFEWTAGQVRYFMIASGIEKELFVVSGSEFVPQRAASLLLNFWHPDSHWAGGGAADYPAEDATLRLDGVRVWTLTN